MERETIMSPRPLGRTSRKRLGMTNERRTLSNLSDLTSRETDIVCLTIRMIKTALDGAVTRNGEVEMKCSKMKNLHLFVVQLVEGYMALRVCDG